MLVTLLCLLIRMELARGQSATTHSLTREAADELAPLVGGGVNLKHLVNIKVSCALFFVVIASHVLTPACLRCPFYRQGVFGPGGRALHDQRHGSTDPGSAT